MFARDVLKSTQVLLEVDLVDGNAPKQVALRVSEVGDPLLPVTHVFSCRRCIRYLVLPHFLHVDPGLVGLL